MVRLLIFVFLIYILYSLVKKVFGSGSRISRSKPPSGVISEMVQDPYCKIYIPKNEAYKTMLAGKEMFFCSKECAEKYKNRTQD